ncbi:phosphoribulokinase [Mycolicibacterium sp. P9-64]|uniref:phosphoribulokinase n=1 Tax=Mycolicibacterium sp. P9-64 TaxID=2024612 RepID=UPI0011EF9D89|nr:phosphoribulokinase [Mycolicibacterium sp. P9-64]KAA0081934.1 phosphoribulokinase [Mycolicibacterium sp. P9-64]
MPDKIIRIRNASGRGKRRPVVLAIGGDSAAGKTTVTAGLVEALGPDRCVSISADDYHRFDRFERAHKPYTALHPDCNYIDILGQHLQLLATGQSILKPVYDHATGLLIRPQLVEPNEFIIVEGLLPLHSKLARACFDVTVFLDPSEELRRRWKVQRDTTARGYTEVQVLTELAERDDESATYIRPQRAHADVVVRFAPIEGRNDPDTTPVSAELLLRPTVRQPDLSAVLQPEITHTMHMRLTRDTDGRPVDSVHVHGYSSTEENDRLEKMIWYALCDGDIDVVERLGWISADQRSTPLAIAQMVLLHHLLNDGR